MQQYIIYAWDGTDEEAAARRLKVRPDHFISASKMKAEGNFITGGAILDENGVMKGSMMLVQFEKREQLEAWLDVEPYIKGKVWERFEVHPFRIADIQ